MHTTVLRVDPNHSAKEALVSIMWNASPQRARESRSSALSLAASVNERSSLIARYRPKVVKYGDHFMAGDYEITIMPFLS